MRRFRAVLIAVAAVLIVLVAVGWGAHDAVAQTIVKSFARKYGYNVSFGRLDLGLSSAHIDGVTVRNTAGQPVFSAQRIDVRYSLEALYKGTHRFGLDFAEIVRPHVTLIHNPDGSYNVKPISLPRGPQKKQAPLWLQLRVRDGSVALIDRYSAYPRVRQESIVGIKVDANLTPHRRSFYNADLALNLDGKLYPIVGRAVFDDPAGYESQRWTAQQIPIAQLLDFALPTHEINVASAVLRDADIRLFSLADAHSVMNSHIGGHVFLDDGKIYAARLQKPIRDAHCEMLFSDDAMTIPRLDATLAGIPLAAAGGVYDFSAPTIRFGLRGAAPLERLRTFAAAAANRPISGPLAFRMLAIGSLEKPVLFAAFASPHIAYQNVRVTAAHGLVAVQGTEMDVVGASLQYGPLQVAAHGRMQLEKHTLTTLVATVSGPSDRLPYLAQIVPHMIVHGLAVVSGVDRSVSFDSVLGGANGQQQLSGIASVAPNGTGTAGPISIDGPGGESLYARVALDHPHSDNAIFLGAHDFAIRTVHKTPPAFPGLPFKSLPAIDGVVDANAVAVQHGKGLEFLGGDAAVASAHMNGIGLDRLLAVGDMVRGEVTLIADVRDSSAAFRRFGIPLSSGKMEAVAHVDGKLSAPNATVSAMLVGGRVAHAPVSGNISLAYDGGDRLRILGSTLSLGGGLGTASGTVVGIRSGKPRYDLSAQMREADLAVLTTTFGVHLPYPEGSLEADAHVKGAGKNPAIAGDVSIPEASINALPFHGGTAFSGDASRIVTHGGRIVIGSTQLDFSADVGAASKAMTISSSAVDLTDFNPYFPVAETLAGKGSLLASFSQNDGTVTTRGTIALSHVRYRRFSIGNTYANWSTAGRTVIAMGKVAGNGGRVDLAATAHLASGTSPAAIAARTFLDASTTVRGFDLATWLPAAGINAPILGQIDADATAQGYMPTLSFDANATLIGGIVNQVPIQRFTVSATASRGQGRIVAADLRIPYLNATAGGTFGFQPQSPVALTLHAVSPDIGALAHTVTHKNYDYHGAVDTTLRATGQLRRPSLDDVVDLTNFTYHDFRLPHAHTEIAITPGMLDVKNGSVAFVRGSATFAAHVPVAIGGLALRAGGPPAPHLPIKGRIEAHAIGLAQFASLMPKGTKLGGTLGGTVTIAGTDVAPLFGGSLGLANASYSGPQESSPLTKGSATLAFAGTRAMLSRLHFAVGKGRHPGSIDGHGTFDVPNLRDPLHSASFNVAATLSRAVFDLPKYFSGQLDGTFGASKTATGIPLITGDLFVSHTRIPAAAIIAQALAKPSGAKPPPLAMNFKVALGPDVRVQGAGVDVGAGGALAMSGTLAAPKINGTISSTGGTINMYRDFTLQHGVVTFNGASIIPNVNAMATTFLPQPPTDVRLHVTGPATHMNLALTSNPPYDKAQIIALMIGGPSLAGINGLQTAQGPAPPSFLQGAGEGYINGLFARNLLEPLQSNLGTALGLQNVQLNYDIAGQGGFSAEVRKGIGNNLSLLFATTVGFPSRTTFGVDDRINANSSARFTLFSTYGQEGFGYYPSFLAAQPGNNISLQAQQPMAGQQGFGVNYVRHFGK
jgi:autotransporter translocation and assembly factor TamB